MTSVDHGTGVNAPISDLRTPLREDNTTKLVDGMRGFRPDIEGLRAVAVLLVIFFHAGVPLFDGGFVGVDVFFVISGFLITRLLATELLTTGQVSLPDFYLRRARRLLPALALVIVTSLVLARLQAPLMVTSAAADGIWASFYLVNFRFMATGLNYFAADLPDSPFLHLWSLAIEEQFYLIWPAILLLFASHGRTGSLRTVAIAISVFGGASLLASILSTASYPVQAYYLPMTRIWELFAGAFLAIIPQHRIRTSTEIATLMAVTGLGAIFVAGTTFTTETVFPGSAALLPVVGTIAVIASAPFAAVIRVPLGSIAMQWIGKRSYSLYLWHWPLLVLFAGAGTSEQSLPISLIVLGGSILLAAITYRVIENPIRRSEFFKVSRKHGLILAAFLTFLPVMLAAWMIQSPRNLTDDSAQVTAQTLGTADGAMTRLHAALEEGVMIKHLPSNLVPPLDQNPFDLDSFPFKRHKTREACVKRTSEGNLAALECVNGVVSSDATVVLFGDSHAMHWEAALGQIAERREWKIVQFTLGACPSMDFFPHILAEKFSQQRAQECVKSRKYFVQRIALEKPSFVILSNHHIYCDRADCPAGIASMIGTIRKASPDSVVLVLEDIPYHSRSPVSCLGKNRKSIQNCTVDRDTIEAQGRDEIASAVLESGAVWVETTDWFCTATSCPLIVKNVRVMLDRNHMTSEMSLLLAPILEKSLDSSLSGGINKLNSLGSPGQDEEKRTQNP
jgi:peptidoglycan/LPS O-acetylase OafA/YrhL